MDEQIYTQQEAFDTSVEQFIKDADEYNDKNKLLLVLKNCVYSKDLAKYFFSNFNEKHLNSVDKKINVVYTSFKFGHESGRLTEAFVIAMYDAFRQLEEYRELERVYDWLAINESMALNYVDKYFL